MRRDEVIAKLRDHARELQEAGIIHLHLHGSVARGGESPQSDVDLIAEIDRAHGLTLLDMAGLENRLADILGVRVDLSDRRMLKDAVRISAEREAILVF